MKAFDQYYTAGDPLEKTIDDLKDPALSFEKHREQVNNLVANLVIKYMARYLELKEDDIGLIKNEVVKAVEKTPGELIGYLLQVVDNVSGGGFVAPTDAAATECLSDIKATSAIVKEIIFNNRFDKEVPFIGVDLGAGSGILTLAGHIAACRSCVRESLVLGVEIQPEAARKAGNLLEQVIPGSYRMDPIDVLHPAFWELFRGLPLSSWISETFGFLTPKLKVAGDGFEIERGLENSFNVAMNTNFDPFPSTLGNTVQNRRNFFKDIREGRTAMFPDLVNGLYMPNNHNSKMAIRTAVDRNPVSLDRIGEEFSDYEDFGLREKRWQAEDPSDFDPDKMKGLGKVLELCFGAVGDIRKGK